MRKLKKWKKLETKGNKGKWSTVPIRFYLCS